VIPEMKCLSARIDDVVAEQYRRVAITGFDCGVGS
jgi:hypothetical protein